MQKDRRELSSLRHVVVIISALLGVLPTLGQPLGRNLGNPCETHGGTLRVTGWPKKFSVATSCHCVIYYLKKHAPCFFRVIETRVEVWENEKWEPELQASVSAAFF